jgi:hypothetical protein
LTYLEDCTQQLQITHSFQAYSEHFSKTHHMLHCKASLNKFQRTEIKLQIIKHNAIKPEINKKKRLLGAPYVYKLRNMPPKYWMKISQWKQEYILPRSGGEGKVAQTMYTHVSKCKNDKIKKENLKKKRRIQSALHNHGF